MYRSAYSLGIGCKCKAMAYFKTLRSRSYFQKYGLTKDDPSEKLDFRFSGSSKNLKQNLESLFAQLNRMEFITSKELYEQALELFQVEIRRAGRGHLVFVTDECGNPIRHPVRMSDFEERPRFLIGQTYRYAPVESRYRETRLPDHFKRELLKALGYRLEEFPTRPDQAGRKRKNKIGRKKGKQY